MTMVTNETLGRVGRGETAGSTAVAQEGLIAGLLGAASIAVWFLILDALDGRPLYTPTVLGTFLFRRGAEATGTLMPSLEMAFVFTWVHALVFILIGVGASYLLQVAERYPNVGFGILLLFVVFEFSFVVAAATLAEGVLQALSWYRVLIGNLMAAAAMGAYFWARHPNLRIEP